ncbi:MAG: hypothetical protein ACE5OZ_23365 [Candidatus Heimdallarchaeota archaeon]
MLIAKLQRRILGPYRLSHHPLCDNFSEHIYFIRGKKICRGCTMQYSGMAAALLIIGLGFVFGWWSGLTGWELAPILYFMIVPTFLTAFLVKNRLMKDISRFLLGMAFTTAFVMLILDPDWLVKGIILIHFIPGYIYLKRRRSQQNEDICTHCVEYPTMPHCSGYQVYADRERIFVSQAVQGGIQDPFAVAPEKLQEE